MFYITFFIIYKRGVYILVLDMMPTHKDKIQINFRCPGSPNLATQHGFLNYLVKMVTVILFFTWTINLSSASSFSLIDDPFYFSVSFVLLFPPFLPSL